jgi:AraC-like DNA-binding protein
MSILKIAVLLGAAQGIITSLVLFSYGKSHKKANYFLSFAVLMMAINLFADYFFDIKGMQGFLNHTHFHPLTGFAYGPLIYLYVRALAGFTLPGKRTILFFSLPFCCASIYIAVCLLPQFGFNHVLNRYFFIIEITSLVYMLLFTIMAIVCLYRHERAIKDSYSNLKNHSLQWLRLIIYSTGVIIVSAAVLYFWRAYFDIVWLLIAFLIYLMSYFTLRKPEMISGLIDVDSINKYRNSPVNTTMLRDGKLLIDRLMEKDKLFLDNEITLPLLAERMSLPVHHVSQIINQVYHKNFYEYIGYYRIQAAKEMMLSPEFDEQKIIDICYRVGFNTISAFNKSFKNNTGFTPSQFRTKHRHK